MNNENNMYVYHSHEKKKPIDFRNVIFDTYIWPLSLHFETVYHNNQYVQTIKNCVETLKYIHVLHWTRYV